MSTETKWTPGPWITVPSLPQEGFECFWIHSKASFEANWRSTLGSVDGPQNETQQANANLIAAAPELYEAAVIGRKVLSGTIEELLASHCLLNTDTLRPIRQTLASDVAVVVAALEDEKAVIDAALSKARGEAQ